MTRKYAIETAGTGWREELVKRRTQWDNKNLDEVHTAIEDFVFKEAANGAKLLNIARQFGVPYLEFRNMYGDVWALGNALLQNTIAGDTLDYGLKSNIPVAKIWMGKALGGLGEGGSVASVEADDSDDGAVNIKVNIVRKQRDETAEE